MVAVSVSTPDRTSKSLVRTSTSILGGRAFTQVKTCPSHAHSYGFGDWLSTGLGT